MAVQPDKVRLYFFSPIKRRIYLHTLGHAIKHRYLSKIIGGIKVLTCKVFFTSRWLELNVVSRIYNMILEIGTTVNNFTERYIFCDDWNIFLWIKKCLTLDSNGVKLKTMFEKPLVEKPWVSMLLTSRYVSLAHWINVHRL